MNRLTIVLLLGLALVACEDVVKFEEPQPVGKKGLNQIPGRLRGTYFSASDSTFLTINKTQIIEWVDIESRTLIDSLDIEIDSTKITGQTSDSIQISEGAYTLSFKFLPGDSVIVYYSYKYTIFEISHDHLLKRFKGHYFLNYRRTDNNWRVRRLTLNNDDLSFSRIRVPEDITQLKEITEVQELKSDSVKVISYKLNPTRKELKRLMNHSFSETKKYKKLE